MAYNCSMCRILFWSIFGFFALITATATWLWTADLGVFKPQLEKWVTENVGREFAIDGDLSVDLGRETIVIANDVRFANPGWVGDEQMVKVGYAEIRVNTSSLWKGPVVFELVDIDDAEVILANREDGAPNWVLDSKRPTQATEDDAPRQPVLFQRIDVSRLHLVSDGPNRTQPLDVRLQSFNEVHRADDILEFSIDAEINDRPVSVTGEAGGWLALLAGKDIRYKLDAQLDTFELRSDGRIDDIGNIRRPNFNFEAAGPDINDLLRLLSLEEKDEGDIKISGSLTPTNDKLLALNVKGHFGRLQIEAVGSLSDLKDFDKVDVDVRADSPNLGRLLRLVGIDQVGEAPFHLDIDATRDGNDLVVRKAEMLFGDATFNLAATMPRFPTFDDSNVSLNIEGSDLDRLRALTQLPGKASGKFALNANIDTSPDGGNQMQADIRTSFGVVEARGMLTQAPGHIGSQLDFNASGDNLALVGEAYGMGRLPDKPFEIGGGVILQQDGLRTTRPVVGTVNGISITLDGLAELKGGLQRSDVDFNVAGPDLAVLVGAFSSVKYVPNQPFDVTGKLRIRDNGLGFHGTTGTIGTSRVSIEGLLVPRHGLHGSTFTVGASGPAFEEIVDQLDTLEITAGRYDLSGKIGLLEDSYRFDDVKLKRDQGELSLDLKIGRPASRKWMEFNLRGQGHDIRTVFDGTERFKINEMPYTIVARGERNGERWSFEGASLDADGIKLQADGTLDFGGDESGTRFRFHGTIPDLSRTGTIDGRLMRPQSVTWDAVLDGADGELRVDDLNAQFGNSDINGSLFFKTGDVPELTVELQSDSIVFEPLTEERTSEQEEAAPRSDEHLIPDVPVPFADMAKLNAAVSLDVGELQRDGLHLHNLHLNAELRDGRLDIHDIGFEASAGHLRARAIIDPSGGEGGVSLDVAAEELKPGVTEWNLDPAMTWNADISISASGNDLRTLLSNSNGVFFVDVRGGKADNRRVPNMLYGDLLDEIFGAVNPFRESNTFTQIDCIVIPIKIDNGIATHSPNAFVQTDKLRIAASARIDLKTERLEAAVETTPRRGVVISAGELINPFVKLTGTLASPRIAVDQQGVLVTGGAAVATGGLSIVAKSVWDRVKRTSDVCNATAEAGRELLRIPVVETPVR